MATLVRRKGRTNWYMVAYEGDKRRWRALPTSDEDAARRMMNEIEAARQGRNNDERLRELLVEAANVEVERPQVKLAALWDTFLEQPKRRQVSRQTQRTKRLHVQSWLEWMAATYPDIVALHEVTDRMASQYFTDFGRKVSGQTYNNHLSSVRSVVESLRLPAGLDHNPFAAIPRLEARPIRKEAFTVDQVRDLVAAAEGFGRIPGFWSLAIQLSYYTGLRLADVCHLSAESLDFTHQAIRVETKKLRRKGQVLYLPLPSPLWERLAALAKDTEGYLWPEAVEGHKKLGVWLSREWNRLCRKIGLTTYRPAREDEHRANGVKIYGFHSLRHAFVTAALDEGAELGDIQLAAGHHTTAMTSHYSHSLAPAMRVLERLPRL